MLIKENYIQATSKQGTWSEVALALGKCEQKSIFFD